MKKFILFSLLSLFCITAFAQKKDGHGHKGKEVLEFKMKYLAQEMELSEDQQKKFFDLYTQLDNDVRTIFQDVRSKEKKVKADGAKATEADYAALNKARTDAKAKIAELEKTYDVRFSAFLSKKQIVKMKEAEAEFRKKMKEVHRKKQKK